MMSHDTSLLSIGQGDIGAQYNLAILCSKGEGTDKDDAQAAFWFRKAALQGHAKSQFNLGICYREGLGVKRSRALAARWFFLAAEQGLVRHSDGSEPADKGGYCSVM